MRAQRERESTGDQLQGPQVIATFIPKDRTIKLCFALLCLIWGSTWIVIKTGLKDIPPVTSVAARLVVASVLMAVLAGVLWKKEGGRKPPLWLSVVLGLTNFAGSYMIVYLCETKLPSTHMSILWAIFPLLMAVVAYVLLPAERMRPRQILGLGLGLLGVYVLHATDVTALGPEALTAARILILSPVIVAVGNVLIKRFGKGCNSLLLNRDGMLIGAIVTVACAFWFESEKSIVWTRTAVLSVLYLAVIGTVVTFSLYFWLLRFATAVQMSLIAYLTPMIAAILGYVFHEDPITWMTLFGGLLILMGVAMGSSFGRSQTRAKASAS